MRKETGGYVEGKRAQGEVESSQRQAKGSREKVVGLLCVWWSVCSLGIMLN